MSRNDKNYKYSNKSDSAADPFEVEEAKRQISAWGSYCPLCGYKKKSSDIKLLKVVPFGYMGNGKIYYFSSVCQKCGIKNLFVFTPKWGIQMSQISSDALLEELMNKFFTPLTPDDYLNFYKQMKSVNSVSDLLRLIHE